MDVNSTNNAVNLQNYLSTASTSSKQGVDSDGDNDGSRGGGSAQGTSFQSSATAAFSIQISSAGQARHAHGRHGPFNAKEFMGKLDTSGLTSDQQQTLQNILSKYDGSPMTKDKMKQLVTDLKNAGFDTQKLFDKFQRPPGGQRASGNQTGVSTLA